MGIKIAIYSRKSKFTGQGDSVKNQVEMCKKYVSDKFDENEIDRLDIYEDEGFSGKNLDRPEFKRFMQAEKTDPYNYLIVYRLDRISRNVGDFAKLIEKLKTLETSFISITESFDTSTVMGEAMMNIASVFAQLERQTIAERIKDNMYMLAKQGKWSGGITPYGYKSLKQTDDTHSYFVLMQDENEIETAKFIFRKYSELQSLNALTDFLNNNGYRSRSGVEFQASTLRRMIQNPVYVIADIDAMNYFTQLGCNVCYTEEDTVDSNKNQYGILPYNRTKSTNKGIIPNTPDKWIITQSRHKAIITGAEYIRLMNIMDNNRKSAYGGKPRQRNTYNPECLLSGILKCKCGAYMRPKKTRTGNYFYTCETKMKTHKQKCQNVNLNYKVADGLVLNEIFNYQVNDNQVGKQLTLMQNQLNTIDTDINSQIKATIKKIERNRKKVDVLTDTMLDELLENDNQEQKTKIRKFYNNKINMLLEENNILEKKLQEMQDKDKVKSDMQITIDKIESAIDYLHKNYNDLSMQQKRETLKTIIDKVVFDGKNLNIFIRGVL